MRSVAVLFALIGILGGPGDKYYTLADYATVKKYDAHVHINTRDPYFVRHSLEDNFRLLSINVDVSDLPPIEQQRACCVRQLENFPCDFAYATTFSLTGWNDADWADRTKAYLAESFKQGAIAVKAWKNIGMELKDRDGKFVLIDDPRFDPIINFIESNGRTLVGHIGEPRNCWLPLKDMTVKNDRDYFSTHPQYHMYLHPEYPSYEQLVDARDSMLSKHRHLRFVGAHLGSLEWSVDELAKRLDKFPEMAVDLAERISHLEYQAVGNYRKVRDFIIKYQDRIIYGTDIRVDDSMDSTELIRRIHQTRLEDWKFFTSDEMMDAPEVESKFRSLHLPREVVDKIYRKNAEKWYPGLLSRCQSVAFKPEVLVRKTEDFDVSGDSSNKHWKQTDWVNVAQRNGRDTTYTTKAKVLYSGTGMYFLFQCADKRLTATLSADLSDLWNEDVVEVFLQPDARRSAYFEYELSPLNYELPIVVYNDPGRMSRWLPFHYSGDGKARHATHIWSGERKALAAVQGWTAEFFVPYTLLRPLTDSIPVSGSRWRGNFYRIDYDQAQTLFSWSQTMTSFHDYDRFGSLVFE